MPVRRNQRGRWIYRTTVRLPDGTKKRIFGTPTRDTKRAAERAERDHIDRVLGLNQVEPISRQPELTLQPEKKEVPLFREYADHFLDICALRNKPSEIATKESILRVHLVPFFGRMHLDDIRYATIQDYIAEKSTTLSPKSINNHLTVLRRALVIAKKRELIFSVPEVEWLKTQKPDYDFLEFEEADRLVKAADPYWAPMIFIALRTGMRLGELRALCWEDVDLVSERVRVCRSLTRGVVTTPKSGRARTIPLGTDAVAAMKQQRPSALKGELVFCTPDGGTVTKAGSRNVLWRACRKSGLDRKIGWHVLRHTFASHLVMRKVPLKVVQELLGHATIEMTMRYAHLSDDMPIEAVKALDSGAWHRRGIRTASGATGTGKVLEMNKK